MEGEVKTEPETTENVFLFETAHPKPLGEEAIKEIKAAGKTHAQKFFDALNRYQTQGESLFSTLDWETFKTKVEMIAGGKDYKATTKKAQDAFDKTVTTLSQEGWKAEQYWPVAELAFLAAYEEEKFEESGVFSPLRDWAKSGAYRIELFSPNNERKIRLLFLKENQEIISLEFTPVT